MIRARSEADLKGLTPGTKETARFGIAQKKPVFICEPGDDIREVIKAVNKVIDK